MKNIFKKIVIILIIVLTTFIALISYYKFTRKSKIDDGLMILELKNNPKISNSSNKYNNVKEAYSSNFPYNIKYFNEQYDFSGILDLKDGELTLYDNYTKETKKLVDSYIEKIALGNPNSLNMILIYALSKDNDLYYIKLEEGSLDDISVKKFNLKVNYMTDLVSYMLNDELRFNITVYTKDNKYYLMPYEIPYEKDMIVVNDKYAIYKNNITTIEGKILKNEKGKDIIAKYIINVDTESNEFSGEPEEIIITNDNRIVYVINDRLIINNKIIKKFKLIKDEEISTFEIIYEDGNKMIFKGYYDKDFNKFDKK